MKIKLGFSTCPNDTFMFDALVHGRIDTRGYEFEVVLADIHLLNQMALRGELDMVKVSYNLYGHLRGQYALLEAGSAMGKGCGPLLIAREQSDIAALIARNAKVAIPGRQTTANLLLSYYAPALTHREEMLFHEVMPAVLDGRADLGLIIHENRFTYQDLGLVCIQDLGEYWESQTGLPIPLGAIVARETLGRAVIDDLDGILRASVAHAFAQPQDAQPYIRAHAQELSAAVTQAHIDLYVNEFSLGMGEEGHRAVAALLQVGEGMGLYPQLSNSNS
jgi:1,4-dihydroxy-6-naphthoate synthase